MTRQLKGRRTLFAVLAPLMAAALLAACTSPDYAKRRPKPVEVAQFVDELSFPPQAGGYQRGRAYMFEPGQRNFSIQYLRLDADVENVVTLFFLPPDRRTEERFGAEKLSVLRAHPGAKLTGEKRTLLLKNGFSYDAYTASFEWEGMFADREQLVASQLILVALPNRSVTVWSSAPVAQAASAEKSLQVLLQLIDWAY